jgi:predicted Zn-dependent protease
MRTNSQNKLWILVLLAMFLLCSLPLIQTMVINLGNIYFIQSGILSGRNNNGKLEKSLWINNIQNQLGYSLKSNSYRLLGLGQWQLSNIDDAEKNLKIASKSGNYLANYDLTYIYVEKKDWKWAAEYISKAQPGNNQLINQFIDKLLEKQRSDDAIQLAKEYLLLVPDSPGTYYRLANLLWNLGDREGTIAALSNALKYDPDINSLNYNYQVARMEYLRNNFHQSEIILNKILEQHPDHFPSLYMAGQVALEQHKPSEAISYFLKAVGENPNHIWSHKQLAEAYLLTGQLEQAVDEYKSASILSIDPIDLLKTIAATYQKMGSLCHQEEVQKIAIMIEKGTNPNLKSDYERIDQLCDQSP